MRRALALGIVAMLAFVACEAPAQDAGDAEAGQMDQESTPRLYPDRADAQESDIEKRIGESATVGGIEATVTAAEFQQQLSEFETEGYLRVDISLRNTDDSTHPYNTFDWRLQTPEGQVLDPSFSGENDLGSGDLVAGGTKEGSVTFEVGGTKGNFYILYKPGLIDATRGVWQATI